MEAHAPWKAEEAVELKVNKRLGRKFQCPISCKSGIIFAKVNGGSSWAVEEMGRLMASAPEMLEALKLALAVLKKEEPGDDVDMLALAEEAVQDAVEKAMGVERKEVKV